VRNGRGDLRWKSIAPGAVLILLFFAAVGGARANDTFGKTWHDGRAEIDGYRLTVERYGEKRAGQAVMIYVTEPFRISTRVKADDPSQDPGDVTEVLKLNLVRDFQTGIYDYNTMASIFCRTSDFSPLKISFTSAEWCGQIYSESIFHDDAIELKVFSYFEGESGVTRLDRPAGGVTEEELFIRLRGLKGDFLEPGASIELPFLPSAFVQRLLHRKAEWTRVAITRDRATDAVTVPAGVFRAIVYRLEIADGRTGRFEIEAESPHRILRWSLAPDLEGVLTGSMRTPYWKQNHEGDEALLQELGLGPAVTRQ